MREQTGNGFIECRRKNAATQNGSRVSLAHSPAAASLLAVEIEGNAILKWARLENEDEEEGGEGGGIEDVKKNNGKHITTPCFSLEMGAKNNLVF